MVRMHCDKSQGVEHRRRNRDKETREEERYWTSQEMRACVENPVDSIFRKTILDLRPKRRSST